MTDPGKYKHRVRFERLEDQVDSSGEVLQDPTSGAVNQDWVPIATKWCSIEPLSAREFFASRSLQADYTARIECGYDARLVDTTGVRAVHVINGVDAVIFQITGPALKDRDSGLEYMTFPVKAGVGAGQ